MSKVAIKITCTKKEKDAIENRAKLRGYAYMTDYLRALMQYGLMIEDILDGKSLNAHTFAGAFFDVAEKVMQIGARNIKQGELEEALKEWKTAPTNKRLVTGKVLRPASKPIK